MKRLLVAVLSILSLNTVIAQDASIDQPITSSRIIEFQGYIGYNGLYKDDIASTGYIKFGYRF